MSSLTSKHIMIQEDLFRVITPYLDDTTFEILHTAVHIPTLEKLSRDQFFWKERIETLTGKMITFETGGLTLEVWKEAYSILKRQLSPPSTTTLWNKEDNTLAVLVLINIGYSPEDYPGSLRHAAYKNCAKILKLLLDDGRIDPMEGRDSCTILSYAMNDGHVEATKLLLADKRIDPTENDNEALWYAVRRSNAEVVNLFLQDKRIVLTNDEKDMVIKELSFNALTRQSVITRIHLQQGDMEVVTQD